MNFFLMIYDNFYIYRPSHQDKAVNVSAKSKKN